jgi:hypothetical protein
MPTSFTSMLMSQLMQQEKGTLRDSSTIHGTVCIKCTTYLNFILASYLCDLIIEIFCH